MVWAHGHRAIRGVGNQMKRATGYDEQGTLQVQPTPPPTFRKEEQPGMSTEHWWVAMGPSAQGTSARLPPLPIAPAALWVPSYVKSLGD